MEKNQKRFRIVSFETKIFVEDTMVLDDFGLPLIVGSFLTLPEAVTFIDNKLTPILNK